jgi:hypothetical protein
MPRELIQPHHGDKVTSGERRGKFTTSRVDVVRSLAADRRTTKIAPPSARLVNFIQTARDYGVLTVQR